MKTTNNQITNNMAPITHLSTITHTHTEDSGVIELIKNLFAHILQTNLPEAFEELLHNNPLGNFFFDFLSSDKSEKIKVPVSTPPSFLSTPSNTSGAQKILFRDNLQKYSCPNTDYPDPEIMSEHNTCKKYPGYNYDKQTGSLFVDGISEKDIKQGLVGDCYFLALLSGLAKTQPDFIQNSIKKNYDGSYSVNFYSITTPDKKIRYDENGAYMDCKRNTETVIVDSDLPQLGTMNIYAAGQETSELWVSLYEKAYAQFEGGSYDDISKGTLTEAFMDVLGVTPLSYYHRSTQENTLYTNIKKAIDSDLPVLAATKSSDDGSSISANGLVSGHAYTVLSVSEENGTRHITLRNPWRNQEWNGEGSDKKNDGIFTMPFSDYKENFYQTTTLQPDKYEDLFEPNKNPKLRV